MSTYVEWRKAKLWAGAKLTCKMILCNEDWANAAKERDDVFFVMYRRLTR